MIYWVFFRMLSTSLKFLRMDDDESQNNFENFTALFEHGSWSATWTFLAVQFPHGSVLVGRMHSTSLELISTVEKHKEAKKALEILGLMEDRFLK